LHLIKKFFIFIKKCSWIAKMKSTDWFHRKSINLFRKQSKLVSIRLWIQQYLLPFLCCCFFCFHLWRDVPYLKGKLWCVVFVSKKKITSWCIYMELIHRVKLLHQLTDHFFSSSSYLSYQTECTTCASPNVCNSHVRSD
jgi:hypothetical protein